MAGHELTCKTLRSTAISDGPDAEAATAATRVDALVRLPSCIPPFYCESQVAAMVGYALSLSPSSTRERLPLSLKSLLHSWHLMNDGIVPDGLLVRRCVSLSRL